MAMRPPSMWPRISSCQWKYERPCTASDSPLAIDTVSSRASARV
jgi:hypothetical protein